MSKIPVAALVLLPLISGCAHVSVSDSKRTSNASFNGDWEGVVTGTKERQKLPGWELTCGEVNLNLLVRVNDGVLSGYVKQNENISFETNLNKAGKFYIAIPKREKGYQSKPGSDTYLPSDEFHVFRGQLNPRTESGTGRYVHARNNMGMEGCKTPISFTKRS